MDKYRSCQLKDVRLEGVPAQKMMRHFQNRLLSDFAQKEIFGEARMAIQQRDDDDVPAGGYWRGEFWGKEMLSAARVADYLQDPQLLKFIQEECHRVIAFQDEDGYLGSYRNKERVAFTEETQKQVLETIGWECLWNLWNRKYILWAMMATAKVTGDQEILQSVIRQMDQWIDMMHRLRLPLVQTGCSIIKGLASMSILKPLVLLYEETKDQKYLDYAAEMLPDWDREDGFGLNFFRNAFNNQELWQWHPLPQGWAKTYEMSSCLDGLLEYYRVTGEKRCLDTVVAMHAKMIQSDMSPLGSPGFADKLIGAAHYPNAAIEVCDVIHWIRLSYDLFLITGENKYLDCMENAYFNAFLAGVFRDGNWSAFLVRANSRHWAARQCNTAYSHCCTNNVPRTYMDMASAVVTRDQEGVFQVNFFQDATATLDGVTFQIRGNYPVENKVTVTVSDPAAKVRFRHPAWCPKMDIAETNGIYTLLFDMNPRIVERDNALLAADVSDKSAWHYKRFLGELPNQGEGDPLSRHYRTTMAATMKYGPLLLARACRTGMLQSALYDGETVNGQGCTLSLTPVQGNAFCWGVWNAEIKKDGKTVAAFPVCDFQSAGDSHFDGYMGDAFNIWV